MDETPKPKRRVNLPGKYARAAVLVSRGVPHRAIAKQLGISGGTLHNWTQRPDFLRKIETFRAESFEAWEAHNLACLRRASKELDKHMKDPEAKFSDKVVVFKIRADLAVNWFSVRPLELARKRMEDKDTTP